MISSRAEPATHQPLRFPIQDIYRFDDRRILAGRIESGALKVGDRLVFAPTNKVSTVKTIERWNAPPADRAEAGESIGITLTEQIFVERGAVAALETAPPYRVEPVQGAPVLAGPRPVPQGPALQAQAGHPGGGMRNRLHRAGHGFLHAGNHCARGSLCRAQRSGRIDVCAPSAPSPSMSIRRSSPRAAL